MIERRSLSEGWEFSEAGQDAWADATVPGCVQLDLLDHDRLPDPNYRMDEHAMQTIEEKDWEYRSSFQVSAKDLEADEIDLVFEGLDTYADLYLNDLFLASTANMFVSHSFDVTEAVREGTNYLRVYLHSPVTTIRTLEENSPLSLASSCETARPYIRKAQYACGWDWGPRIVQVGLWRPVHLDIVRLVRILHPYAYTVALRDDAALVRVQGDLDAFTDESLQARISISLQAQPCATVSVACRTSPTATWPSRFSRVTELWTRR